jgi:hypothetical protein
MLHPHLLFETLECRANALQWQPRLAECGEHHALGEPHERDREPPIWDAREQGPSPHHLATSRPPLVPTNPGVERCPRYAQIRRGLGDRVERLGEAEIFRIQRALLLPVTSKTVLPGCVSVVEDP